jgi:hypothetical protein
MDTKLEKFWGPFIFLISLKVARAKNTSMARLGRTISPIDDTLLKVSYNKPKPARMTGLTGLVHRALTFCTRSKQKKLMGLPLLLFLRVF